MQEASAPPCPTPCPPCPTTCPPCPAPCSPCPAPPSYPAPSLPRRSLQGSLERSTRNGKSLQGSLDRSSRNGTLRSSISNQKLQDNIPDSEENLCDRKECSSSLPPCPPSPSSPLPPCPPCPSTPPPPPPPLSGAPVWERRPRELELEIFAVPLSASSTSKCPLLSRSCPSSLHRYFQPPPKNSAAFREKFTCPKYFACPTFSSSYSPHKGFSRRPLPCPLLVSLLAVCLTLAVTASVLFWNYSETRHRRLTKKPSLILDHWGKKGPLLDDPDLVGAGGIVVYGETALRGDGNFHGASKIFPEVGDWQNLSGMMVDNKEDKEEKSKEEETGEKDGLMTRW